MASSKQALHYDELWSDVYGEMQAVGPAHRHMRRLLGGVLRDLDYRTAIDIGCGAGDNVELLYRAGLERFVGVDISLEALGRARGRRTADYLELDIQRQALDEQFDLVFSSLLLEHLPDDATALVNMRAMCRRWLVVSTIAGDFDRYRAWDEQVGHVRNYARGELEGKLEAAGFEVERTLYWGFPFYSPFGRRLQNHVRTSPTYGAGARLAAGVLYGLYWLNSSRRGDLLIALASPRSGYSAAATTESSSERRGA